MYLAYDVFADYFLIGMKVFYHVCILPLMFKNGYGGVVMIDF